MKYSLDFKECLKDSPKFRLSLENAEADIENLEAKLERVVRLCTTMVEAGKSFNNAGRGFITGVKDLGAYFQDDSMVSSCLNHFCQSMSEMLKYYSTLMDQAQRSVCKNLSQFIKTEIKKVKDTRKHFEKISDDLDNAMSRNSSAPRSKPQECEDACNLMMANRSCFAHTSLDYVYQINILQSKKRFDVLETMLSFMQAQATFFHQGHELYQDSDVYMNNMKDQVRELHAKAKIEWKEMEERHHLVQNKDIGFKPDVEEKDEGVHMEGYLFKKTKHAFKAWVRRWFSIEENQLRYQKRTKDPQVTVMEEDLRLCTVKPAYEIDRRFCFEVVSPSRSHMLQAHTEEEFQAWVSAIQSGVTKAFRDAERRQSDGGLNESRGSSRSSLSDTSNVESPVSNKDKKSKAQIQMEKLYSISGNSKCCDCGASEPRWASINLGITLCIGCSGIHRGFGVHISKIRSITLDSWEPELLKVMAELGNDAVNRIYLVNVDDSVTPATPDCSGPVREAWIKAKYVQKLFVSKLPGPKSSEGKVKGWRVKKKTRKSPARTTSTEENLSLSTKSSPGSDITSAVLSVSSSSKDTDSGVVSDVSISKEPAFSETESDSTLVTTATESESTLVNTASQPGSRPLSTIADTDSLPGSSEDVLVFGTEVPLPDFVLDISSESSGTEEDAKSNTSWEDMSTLDPNRLLYKAAHARNLAVMLEALANGADPNWVNPDEDYKTPIMKAVEAGSLSTSEFLLLNGAKLDRADAQGQTPLLLATMLGNTGQVCQFLKRGADIKVKDKDGKDPLTIAVNNANADIVTLLRLAKLNEEMRESDDYLGANPGDETFNDVFRDFSNMASNNPEKLKRNK